MSFQIVLGRIGSDIWANSRLKIINRFVKHGRVLDLGCGGGYIGKSLTNCDVTFGEINIDEFKGLDSNNKVLLSGLKLPFKSDYFDYVICGDVLEHIEDDGTVLKEINRVLKNDGKAVIMVPAYKRFLGHHDIIMDHKRRYNKKDFKNRANSLNFDIEYARYIGSLLFFPFLINQLLVKSEKTYFGKSKLEPVHGGFCDGFACDINLESNIFE